ncbi:MAG: NosD domain-containing protein, partial [Candidatus Thorarchaeota archaeon]
MANASGSSNKVVVLVLVVILVSAAGISYTLLQNVENPNIPDDVPSEPILDIDEAIEINNDTQFQSYVMEHSLPGTGLRDDPYVISGLSIVEDGICIAIRNVEVAFLIQDCALKSTSDYWGMAIYLSKCTSARVEGCRTEGGISGIEFFQCNDAVIMNCYVGFSFFGINSSASHRAFVKGNTIYNTSWAIAAICSNDTVFESNRILYNEIGLTSQFSYNCSIILSNMTDNVKGVFLDVLCQNWTICYNRFERNVDGNARDDGIWNQWDNGDDFGNYWDDYSGVG